MVGNPEHAMLDLLFRLGVLLLGLGLRHVCGKLSRSLGIGRAHCHQSCREAGARGILHEHAAFLRRQLEVTVHVDNRRCLGRLARQGG